MFFDVGRKLPPTSKTVYERIVFMLYKTDKLQQDDITFFLEMLSYISPYIESAKVTDGGIEISCQSEHEEEVMINAVKLEQMIVGGKFANKKVKTDVIEDYTDKAMLNDKNIFPELILNDMVREIAPGAFAYSEIFLKVFRYFNNKIEEYGRNIFKDIKQYEFPVLYPLKDYKKGGYFESFPHHIMFQSLMKNDLDVIDKFAKKGVDEETIGEDMRSPVNVLRHAGCVPVYSILQNSIVPIDSPRAFLISGKCFRNEENNICELARLNEFYMKEYVFVGTQEQCDSQISRAKKLWHEWTETFGLNCKIMTATDSFFASSYKKLRLFQILGNSKQEFQVRLPGDDRFSACGSVNFHRTHFTKPYNIRQDNDTLAYSACCAFGIERLTYALFSQKGIDPDKWDSKTYNEIFGETK